MRSHLLAAFLMLVVSALAWPVSATASPKGDDAFLGRWDVSSTGYKNGRPLFCWLELTREEGVLKGRFNPGQGAAMPLAQVKIENGELTFQYEQGRRTNRIQVVWKATMKGGRLQGTALIPGDTNWSGSVSWSGVRAPVWPKTPPKRKPGKPIDLIGNDMSGWLCQYDVSPMGWSVKDGIMMNEGKSACNIYTKEKFKDYKLDIEFNVDPGSNGGVFLRGRDEIQIVDAPNRPLDVHSQGALYGFIVPPVRADKAAGEWQTYEITEIANRVTVILNGIKLIDNAEVPGITGGALDANEKEPGPLLLQGDHGRVQFRKVILTPLI